ncbi:uncharacterized protein LOC135222433 [Macrobrachium nipponense]|uniref:uncharacterized protein LOC135222433 n=1 Tax=Macrobrachium nipponense TaxID=159736 RepID=UPI0030C8AAB5
MSAVFRNRGLNIENDKDLHDLIRSFETTKSRTSLTPSWNLDVVLRYLMSERFEPPDKASFRDITRKCIFLIALATAKRVSELQALDSRVGFKGDSAVLSFRPLFLAKNENPSRPWPRTFEVKGLSQLVGNEMERALCPVRALKFYLQKKKQLQGCNQSLWCAVKDPKRPMSKNALAFFVRNVITEAHMSCDSNSFKTLRVKAHEVRAIATSLSFNKNMSMKNILAATYWRCNSVFASHYLRDMVHIYEILQSFSSLGICKVGDSSLIEGTAPPLEQLKFWRGCLDKVWQVHHITGHGHLQKDSLISDRFLDHLANSKHLSVIQKDTGANVIPGHLREKYRANCKYVKSIPYDEVLLEAEEKLKELHNHCSSVDKKWKNSPLITRDIDGAQQQQALCDSISCVTKQQDLFQGVYSTYISPWTKSSSQLDLPDTGPTIHEATTKLYNLTVVLNSMEEVSQKCWELTEQGKQMRKHRNRPSPIMSMLQDIVTLEQNPKPIGITKS